MSTSKKVYCLVLLFCFVGYTWLAYNFIDHEEHAEFTVCFFKNITGMPCPSCGITRSVIQILHGHFLKAILINPLGLLATVILLVMPCWIFIDLYFKKESLLHAYKRGEALLRTQAVYIPLVVLCLLNWYWNITKGL